MDLSEYNDKPLCVICRIRRATRWPLANICDECAKAASDQDDDSPPPGGAVDPDAFLLRQEIETLRAALEPFLTLDRDIGDEWADVCEAARDAHAATERGAVDPDLVAMRAAAHAVLERLALGEDVPPDEYEALRREVERASATPREAV